MRLSSSLYASEPISRLFCSFTRSLSSARNPAMVFVYLPAPSLAPLNISVISCLTDLTSSFALTVSARLRLYSSVTAACACAVAFTSVFSCFCNSSSFSRAASCILTGSPPSLPDTIFLVFVSSTSTLASMLIFWLLSFLMEESKSLSSALSDLTRSTDSLSPFISIEKTFFLSAIFYINLQFLSISMLYDYCRSGQMP